MIIRSKVYWCLDCEDYILRVDEELINCMECGGTNTHDIGWIEDLQKMREHE